jgi:hypothetical protein
MASCYMISTNQGLVMSKNLKKLPVFADEVEEREFWLVHDTTDYLDWSKSRIVSFLDLMPTNATNDKQEYADYLAKKYR